ncbi:histidine phosphatase family protein [Ethanoligenens harbinense]|uniref:Phosphoglycerate mutase n=1 Tax=Ethanoligenens harbinense (strain DSM 18485 / JCM 12961 / CGMCC 1.5033 / YUAN-3) TaxID=663278 RepID=E6U5E4_ETHHY|nr:histidine phosphatase family protein [Ethanoligenens harbinense]ADU25611.1 Phosphoglycerate mutase [Ethanoligenens harbinense YUAN-3]AVQ94788.1 histidine phosphatase family protein [Ethanoligenens harbinense YUAN-3]AYF37479.1 histidine phosphatase family protein [Ethanoligenens harbinense]AYF40199.1 histidine phosphatase family protein [Ethanoligenens harbinense]QCN91034.1 histidine phosphatase family protein [Ethanoligenens harbinense]
MTRIYLIRHAEAEGNLRRIFQGHTDADISTNGQRQLERLSERFEPVHLDALYASPLKRAYKTAQAVDAVRHLPIITLEGLMEINGGCWEGKPWAKLPALYPQDNDAWENRPWDFAPAGGEPMRQVYARMWETLGGIARRHPGKTVGVASHGCAIRNYLCQAHGWPIERLGEVGWCDNTAVSIIEYREGGQVTITMENDASHLDDELSTVAKQDWWRRSTRA